MWLVWSIPQCDGDVSVQYCNILWWPHPTSWWWGIWWQLLSCSEIRGEADASLHELCRIRCSSLYCWEMTCVSSPLIPSPPLPSPALPSPLLFSSLLLSSPPCSEEKTAQVECYDWGPLPQATWWNPNTNSLWRREVKDKATQPEWTVEAAEDFPAHWPSLVWPALVAHLNSSTCT